MFFLKKVEKNQEILLVVLSFLSFPSFVYDFKMADSRPRLVTGSPEGYPGHVDGRLRDARLNNPKGLTVDDRGNIYVADTVNNAIRKISEAGLFFLPAVLWFAFG